MLHLFHLSPKCSMSDGCKRTSSQSTHIDIPSRIPLCAFTTKHTFTFHEEANTHPQLPPPPSPNPSLPTSRGQSEAPQALSSRANDSNLSFALITVRVSCLGLPFGCLLCQEPCHGPRRGHTRSLAESAGGRWRRTNPPGGRGGEGGEGQTGSADVARGGTEGRGWLSR